MAERRDIEAHEPRPVTQEPRVEELHEEAVIESYPGASGLALRLIQGIWLLTTIVVGLIAIRFLLRVLGASQGAAFVQFIYGVTRPLVAPFAGIFPRIEFDYGGVLEPHAIVAVVVYLLLGWVLARLVWLIFGRERTAVARREVHRQT